jgi:hypothetical protein
VAGFNATKTAELYDPSPDQWSPTAPMGTARRLFGDAQLPDGSVVMAGGRESAGGLLGSAELYDPTRGTWTSASAMTSARVGVVLTTLAHGRVLATRGGGPTPLSSSEVYTP